MKKKSLRKKSSKDYGHELYLIMKKKAKRQTERSFASIKSQWPCSCGGKTRHVKHCMWNNKKMVKALKSLMISMSGMMALNHQMYRHTDELFGGKMTAKQLCQRLRHER